MKFQKYKWGKICPFLFQTAKSSYVNPIVCKLGKGGLSKMIKVTRKGRWITRSRTETDMDKAIEDFESSEFWNQKNYLELMSYLSNYWFNVREVSTIILICRSF